MKLVIAFSVEQSQTAIIMKISLLALALLCAAPAVATAQGVSARAPQGTAAPGFSSARAQQIVGEQSRAVVRALQRNDTKTLARFVHPTRGVRFSPYVAVEPKNDRVFRASQIRYLAQHPRVWHWGTYDGSGDEINLTWNEFRQILVPHAYLPLSAGGAREDFNRLSQNGNVPNNLLDFYPHAIFTRYYWAGQNPDYGGLDWRALFFAWRPIGKNWYLVGVANDQWTT